MGGINLGDTPLGTPGMAGMSTPVGLTPNFAAMTPEQVQAGEGDAHKAVEIVDVYVCIYGRVYVHVRMYTCIYGYVYILMP